jgi:hypothetical protein
MNLPEGTLKGNMEGRKERGYKNNGREGRTVGKWKNKRMGES